MDRWQTKAGQIGRRQMGRQKEKRKKEGRQALSNLCFVYSGIQTGSSSNDGSISLPCDTRPSPQANQKRDHTEMIAGTFLVALFRMAEKVQSAYRLMNRYTEGGPSTRWNSMQPGRGERL